MTLEFRDLEECSNPLNSKKVHNQQELSDLLDELRRVCGQGSRLYLSLKVKRLHVATRFKRRL